MQSTSLHFTQPRALGGRQLAGVDAAADGIAPRQCKRLVRAHQAAVRAQHFFRVADRPAAIHRRLRVHRHEQRQQDEEPGHVRPSGVRP
jgi:hypothetical protein